jgi:hypothetical protein
MKNPRQARLAWAIGCAAAITSLSPANASVLNINHTWTGLESVQGTKRLFRNGSSSVAGTQKPFPGTSDNTYTYFYLQDFQAAPGSIVTVKQNASLNSTYSFTSVYSADTPFDPANLALGYLADAGSSGDNIIFQVNVNGSGMLRFVGNSRSGRDSIGAVLDATVTYTAANITPTPGPLPLFGAATAFSFSRRLRRRCKTRGVAR